MRWLWKLVDREAERIDQLVHAALKQTGNRGILLSGSSEVERHAMEGILYREAAPQQRLCVSAHSLSVR